MENWKAIPGYEGRYEVSDLGRVKSLKGTPKILRPGTRSGYRSVVLAVDRVKVNRTVPSLVLQAFVGPKPEGKIVLHGPAGRSVDALSNLRYGSHAENSADMIRDGNSLQGMRHHKAKLTDDQVIAIRADRRGCRRLAPIYGVSRSLITQIKAGKIWRHLLPGGVSSLSS